MPSTLFATPHQHGSLINVIILSTGALESNRQAQNPTRTETERCKSMTNVSLEDNMLPNIVD
jgi:hypothetical protein